MADLAWIRQVLDAGDELVDVTVMGSGPQYLVARKATDLALARARAYYVNGIITVEDFEQALDVIYAS